MKKQYIIIYESSYDKLETRVDEAMGFGYKPHGSLVFRPGDNQGIKDAFIQPMVLKN